MCILRIIQGVTMVSLSDLSAYLYLRFFFLSIPYILLVVWRYQRHDAGKMQEVIGFALEFKYQPGCSTNHLN